MSWQCENRKSCSGRWGSRRNGMQSASEPDYLRPTTPPRRTRDDPESGPGGSSVGDLRIVAVRRTSRRTTPLRCPACRTGPTRSVSSRPPDASWIRVALVPGVLAEVLCVVAETVVGCRSRHGKRIPTRPRSAIGTDTAFLGTPIAWRDSSASSHDTLSTGASCPDSWSCCGFPP